MAENREVGVGLLEGRAGKESMREDGAFGECEPQLSDKSLTTPALLGHAPGPAAQPCAAAP